MVVHGTAGQQTERFPAPEAWLIPQFISLAQVVPGSVKPYIYRIIAELWVKVALISFGTVVCMVMFVFMLIGLFLRGDFKDKFS